MNVIGIGSVERFDDVQPGELFLANDRNGSRSLCMKVLVPDEEGEGETPSCLLMFPDINEAHPQLQKLDYVSNSARVLVLPDATFELLPSPENLAFEVEPKEGEVAVRGEDALLMVRTGRYVYGLNLKNGRFDKTVHFNDIAGVVCRSWQIWQLDRDQYSGALARQPKEGYARMLGRYPRPTVTYAGKKLPEM